MTNVVDFPGVTLARIEPDKILERTAGQFSEVVVIGIDKTAEKNRSIHSSTSDLTMVLAMLRLAEMEVLERMREE